MLGTDDESENTQKQLSARPQTKPGQILVTQPDLQPLPLLPRFLHFFSFPASCGGRPISGPDNLTPVRHLLTVNPHSWWRSLSFLQVYPADLYRRDDVLRPQTSFSTTKQVSVSAGDTIMIQSTHISSSKSIMRSVNGNIKKYVLPSLVTAGFCHFIKERWVYTNNNNISCCSDCSHAVLLQQCYSCSSLQGAGLAKRKSLWLPVKTISSCSRQPDNKPATARRLTGRILTWKSSCRRRHVSSFKDLRMQKGFFTNNSSFPAFKLKLPAGLEPESCWTGLQKPLTLRREGVSQLQWVAEDVRGQTVTNSCCSLRMVWTLNLCSYRNKINESVFLQLEPEF